MNFVKLIFAIAAFSLTAIGVASVFGMISSEHLSEGIGKILLGLGVILVGGLAVKSLSANQDSSGGEPPPVL
ncbi:MAG: hypothetical protein K2X47_04045 [Bdellovibrionales bacterium]|nr:hypothetical protein [Bdellovibrionales bacterium]